LFRRSGLDIQGHAKPDHRRAGLVGNIEAFDLERIDREDVVVSRSGWRRSAAVAGRAEIGAGL
jgi:hypothetical protein